MKPPRLKPWVIAGLSVLCCALIVASHGCRALQPTKTVDDKVLAARELTRQGMSAMVRQQWDEAEQRLRQAVRTCPEDTTARRQYAEALWQAGRQAEAIEQLSRAIEMADSVSAGTYVRLGEMHLAMQQTAAAARMADKALDTHVPGPDAWQLKAAVLEREQRFDEALTSYQRVLSLDPDHQPARLAMGRIYLALGRPQRALATIATLESQLPTGELPPAAARLQASALLELGEPQRAVRTLERALEHARAPDPELLVELARASHAAGDAARTRWALAEARRITPAGAAQDRLDQLESRVASLASDILPPGSTAR